MIVPRLMFGDIVLLLDYHLRERRKPQDLHNGVCEASMENEMPNNTCLSYVCRCDWGLSFDLLIPARQTKRRTP